MQNSDLHSRFTPRSAPGAAVGVLLLIFTLPILAAPSPAQTLTVLHSFTGGNDGGNPEGTLIADRAGNFYSTTWSGGLGQGTVFKFSHQGSGWVVTPLYAFHGQDGSGPQLGLIFGPDGTLYGTTSIGGDTGFGVIYNLRPPPTACRSVSCPWTETVLYTFQGMNDSMDPTGALIFDQSGNLYGTAFGMDISNRHRPASEQGSVWELSHSGDNWTLNVLWGFTSGDALNPAGGVIFDSARNLYGTTFNGGDEGSGTVFELTPSASGWTEQTLHVFNPPTEGSAPEASLILDPAGNLVGATYEGARVFALTPLDGGWLFNTIVTLHADFGPYSNLTMDSQGNLYGTTLEGTGNGTVFKLTPFGNGWSYTKLYSFTGGDDGGLPSGSVTLGADGSLYGTATQGGTYGYGTVWKLTP